MAHDIGVFSNVKSLGKPPDITTSSGLFQQPTEGAPHPGVFNVSVRSRTEPSRSIIIVFKLPLRPGTTFGQLIDALSGMEPFHFRKIGVALFGCRDFMCVLSIPSVAHLLISFLCSLSFLKLTGYSQMAARRPLGLRRGSGGHGKPQHEQYIADRRW